MSETEAAKREALRLLSRSEIFRASLERKLQKKGFSAESVMIALDELCRQKLLDDERCASLWLRARAARLEGRMRLECELHSRGVDRQCAARVLDEYFKDVDEEALCFKAWEKLFAQKQDSLKTRNALTRKGFKAKTILKAERFFLLHQPPQG